MRAKSTVGFLFFLIGFLMASYCKTIWALAKAYDEIDDLKTTPMIIHTCEIKVAENES